MNITTEEIEKQLKRQEAIREALGKFARADINVELAIYFLREELKRLKEKT